MPMYLWKSKKTDEEISILRSMEDCGQGPTKEELVKEGNSDTDVENYIKIIGAPRLVRCDGWRGCKGNW